MDEPLGGGGGGGGGGRWYLERCGEFAHVRSELRLDTRTVTIGRTETMTHVMDENFSYVSRSHVILTFSNGAWFLEDNKSLNGVYVNQRRILAKKRTQLQKDDVIGLGVPTSKLKDKRALIYILRHGGHGAEDRRSESVADGTIVERCQDPSLSDRGAMLTEGETAGCSTRVGETTSPLPRVSEARNSPPCEASAKGVDDEASSSTLAQRTPEKADAGKGSEALNEKNPVLLTCERQRTAHSVLVVPKTGPDDTDISFFLSSLRANSSEAVDRDCAQPLSGTVRRTTGNDCGRPDACLNGDIAGSPRLSDLDDVPLSNLVRRPPTDKTPSMRASHPLCITLSDSEEEEPANVSESQTEATDRYKLKDAKVMVERLSLSAPSPESPSKDTPRLIPVVRETFADANGTDERTEDTATNPIQSEAEVDFSKYTQEDEVIVVLDDDDDYFSSSQNLELDDDSSNDWKSNSDERINDGQNDEKMVSSDNERINHDAADAAVTTDDQLKARLIFSDNDNERESAAKSDVEENAGEPNRIDNDDFFPVLSQAFDSEDDDDEARANKQETQVKKCTFYRIKECSPQARMRTCPRNVPQKKKNKAVDTLRGKLQKQWNLRTPPRRPRAEGDAGSKPRRPKLAKPKTQGPDPARAAVRTTCTKTTTRPATCREVKKTKKSDVGNAASKFRFANRGMFLTDELDKQLDKSYKIPKKKSTSSARSKKAPLSATTLFKPVTEAPPFSLDSLLPPADAGTLSSTESIKGARDNTGNADSKATTSGTASSAEKPSAERSLASSAPTKRSSVTETGAVPPKRVRFAQGTETFEIPANNRVRMKEVKARDGLGAPVVTLASIQLEDILAAILAWNPAWLQQQDHLTTSPPIVTVKIWPTLLSYKSYADYLSVFYPLLLMETWAQVTKQWRCNPAGYVVGAAAIQEVVPVSKLLQLTCYVLVSEDDLRRDRYVHDGQLVILDLPLMNVGETSAEQQKQVIKVFGYVDFCFKLNRRNETTNVVLDQHPLAKNPSARLTKLVVKAKCRQLSIDFHKLMRIQMISYVRPTLRQFSALLHLPRSVLAKNILCPQPIAFELSRSALSRLAAKGCFNNKQKEAIFSVADACSRGCSPRICLLQGPPGTGKTSLIVGLTQQLLYEPGMAQKIGTKPKILLTAPSNAAVDELVLRLLKVKQAGGAQRRLRLIRVGPPAHIHPDVREYTLDALLKSNLKARIKEKSSLESVELEIRALEARKNSVQTALDSLHLRNNVEEAGRCKLKLEDVTNRLQRLREQKDKVLVRNDLVAGWEGRVSWRCDGDGVVCLLQSELCAVDVRKEEQEMLHVLLQGADVIATTLASCRQAFLEFEFNKEVMFTACIVDEASQCIEQDTLLPLMFGMTKLVLVGDPQQLPAIVLSQEAAKMGLNQSLFERFHKYFLDNDLPSPVFMLTKQYRMHPEICRFPSKFFYEGKLESESSLSDKYKDFPLVPYLVFNLRDSQETGKKGGLHNPQEVAFLMRLLRVILNYVTPSTSVGIITPYQAQRSKIKEGVQLESIETAHRIEINTVDGFQGREKDVIILSTVRAKSANGGIGFLSQEKRLNVGLTRAKRCFLVCGHFDTLCVQSYWRALLHDARERGLEIPIGDDTTTEQLNAFVVKPLR